MGTLSASAKLLPCYVLHGKCDFIAFHDTHMLDRDLYYSKLYTAPFSAKNSFDISLIPNVFNLLNGSK